MSTRSRYFPKCLYTAFQSPLLLERALQHFYYEPGSERPLLDLYNNVCHIGHSHPRVQEVVADAYATLNINTRYVDDALTMYASHLSSHLPTVTESQIEWRMLFTNSGSEANDLALQIAMRYTGGLERICAVEGSYHGTTWLCDQMSDLTSTGVKKGRSSSIFLPRVECPLNETIDSLIVECIQGVGGNVDLSAPYLRTLRAHTDLMICDEVQTGFGRSGDTFFAFEKADILPDIITCGKPMANGYPMGACIFRKEWEQYLPPTYFNTFGGSSAACRAADAVLTTIENEDVVKKVGDRGRFLRNKLLALSNVEDVTGHGLFLGIHLSPPFRDEARSIVERLKNDFRIVVGLGYANTIRVKPPTTVTEADLTYFVESLSRLLFE